MSLKLAATPVVAALFAAVLQYYMGRKRDEAKIRRERELERTENQSNWRQTVLRECQAFRGDVDSTTYDNRQQLKEKARDHASRIEELREAPPEIPAEEVRQLERYREAVKNLDYEEVSSMPFPGSQKSKHELKKQREKAKARGDNKKDEFQKRINSFQNSFQKLETVLKES